MSERWVEMEGDAGRARDVILSEASHYVENVRRSAGVREPEPPRRRWIKAERAESPRHLCALANAEDEALTAMSYARRGAVATAACHLAAALMWGELGCLSERAWEEAHDRGERPARGALERARAQVEQLHPWLRGFHTRAGRARQTEERGKDSPS